MLNTTDKFLKTKKNKNSEPIKPHLRNGGKLVKKKKPRVIVAMSGGVDSSVAAALLKKQGYDVIGIFMKLWSPSNSLSAATAARTVADKLGIPFYVVNFAAEFKKMVVDYYIKEYEEGRTPNPCVICNRDIKSELLLKKVLELNGDFLATGHYARIVDSGNPKSKIRNPKQIQNFKLLKGKDKTKDQTYFLWTLTQEKLAKTLFPVGDLTKLEVRKIAKELDLPTAERKESQGICFIPDRDTRGFLCHYAKKLTNSGKTIDISGNEIGTHDGLVNYTIGQREGLGLGGPKAYYVVELKSKENVLVVGEESDLYRKSLIAKDLNWIGGADRVSQIAYRKTADRDITATIRYGHKPEKCQIEHLDENKVKVTFSKPQRAVTAGQSIVFYVGNELLGGGVIES